MTTTASWRAFAATMAAVAFLMCGLRAAAQSATSVGKLEEVPKNPPTLALKTNLLYDAVTTLTLGVERKMAHRWSAEVGAGFNNWNFGNNKQWKNAFVMPELRYWFCDVWDGHFVGAHVFGGAYNMGGIKGMPDFLGTKFSDLEYHRYQGWFVGCGVAYGYDWIRTKHWNIEGEIGIGWAYTRYDRFNCLGCGKKLEENKPHHYFGPTKLALNVIYIL